MTRVSALLPAGALRRCVLLAATIAAMFVPLHGASEPPSGRQGVRIDPSLRKNGEALVALADAVARGERMPSDFPLEWRNDFFKARPGTFVPFTLTLPAGALPSGPALLYIRVAVPGLGRTTAARGAAYAYETIFPVGIARGTEAVHIRRGFAVAPGSYRVTVVLQEGPSRDGRDDQPRRTGTLEQALEVPNFWTGQLAISTVVQAERIEPLSDPVPTDELDEDPYAIGTHRIHPASGSVYNRRQELTVVLLVYNPTVGPDKHFDVQLDYHLWRKNPGGEPAGRSGGSKERPGEVYVTRTNPQRFNPSLMGPRFDPASGAPVLAGQAIPLTDFEAGEYRLNITVTDLLSRRTLSRDVTFSVIGS